MGRRAITIKPIDDVKRSNATFHKRKRGLFKKAQELSILCNCEVEITLINHTVRAGRCRVVYGAGEKEGGDDSSSISSSSDSGSVSESTSSTSTGSRDKPLQETKEDLIHASSATPTTEHERGAEGQATEIRSESSP